MTYTDGRHLVADSLKELHEFAQKMGLKREWFQDHPRHPHYDITTTNKLHKIVCNGALLVSPRTIVWLAKKVIREASND